MLLKLGRTQVYFAAAFSFFDWLEVVFKPLVGLMLAGTLVLIKGNQGPGNEE